MPTTAANEAKRCSSQPTQGGSAQSRGSWVTVHEATLGGDPTGADDGQTGDPQGGDGADRGTARAGLAEAMHKIRVASAPCRGSFGTDRILRRSVARTT